MPAGERRAQHGGGDIRFLAEMGEGVPRQRLGLDGAEQLVMEIRGRRDVPLDQGSQRLVDVEPAASGEA